MLTGLNWSDSSIALVPKLCLGTRGSQALLGTTGHLHWDSRAIVRSRASLRYVPKRSLGTRGGARNEG